MSYHTITAERINELRKLADSLKSDTELAALAIMWGARSMQGADEDLLSCGEMTIDELYQGRDCLERAVEYIHDTINRDDMMQVVNENDLGDYGLKVEVVMKFVIGSAV